MNKLEMIAVGNVSNHKLNPKPLGIGFEQGSLYKVKIIAEEKYLLGVTRSHNRIIVKNYEEYVGTNQPVLIRVNLNKNPEEKIAQVVNPNAPKIFNSSTVEEYALVGLWKDYMQRRVEVPLFNEATKYFRFKDIRVYHYLKTNTSKKRRTFKALKNGRVTSRNLSVSQLIIKEYPRLHNNTPRIIILDDEDNIEKIKRLILNCGVTPIDFHSFYKKRN